MSGVFTQSGTARNLSRSYGGALVPLLTIEYRLVLVIKVKVSI